jgi:hypothetical protein
MAETVARFSPDERRTLDSVLDEIIPPSPDGRLPGAGELGLAGHVEQVLARSPELVPLVAGGLAALDEVARGLGSPHFAALSGPQRVEALGGLAATQPQFLPSLVVHVYLGYYQAPRVLEGLGLEARPPFPRGHAVEPGDLSLLDPVRRRPKMYRDC